MITTLRPTLVEEIEEGDIIEAATGDYRFVVDIRENARMNGAWLECSDCSALFYQYGNKINRAVDRKELFI